MQEDFSHTWPGKASLTRRPGSDRCGRVNRILAIALSTAIALAAPAAASAAVQIDFHKWTVTTQNGKEHRVSPGGTFKRCGRKVTRLTATYDYDGATPGQS